VGFCTQSAGDALESRIAAAIIEQAATQIFLPNPKARAADYAKLYPASDDLTAERASEQSERDNHFGWQSWTWAKRQGLTGKSRAWYYFFDVQAPPGNGAAVANDWGAHHEGEIPYVFGTGVNWGERDRRVSDRMQDYWVNFARTGDPNGAGLPAWSAFDAARPVHMVFDDAPSARPLAGQDRLAFWEAQAKQ
jgi:para-nitrobenzyl esterase